MTDFDSPLEPADAYPAWWNTVARSDREHARSFALAHSSSQRSKDARDLCARSLSLRASSLALREETLAGAVLLLAVLFNAGLAFINAHFAPLGTRHVILAEISVVGMSLLITTVFMRRSMLPWLMLLLFFVAMHLTMTMIQSAFNPKALRDILIVPTFVMLGITFARGNIAKLLCYLHSIIFSFLVVELATPELFQKLFNIPSYYIGTRGFTEDQFWAPGTGLFVSALRPGDRFLLDVFNFHRASSVFLEPVSLGNYCIIVTSAVIALWREMPSTTRLYLLSTTVLMLIGSDGRLATVTCIFFAISFLFFQHAPRYTHVFYMPSIIASAIAVVSVLGLHGDGDDFTGRVSKSVYLLSSIDSGAIVHGSSLLGRYLDSGISYFIASQSILGIVVFWLAICLMPALSSRAERVFVHMSCLYVSFNLLVSYSVFSIKTATILWFLYGYFYARAPSARSPCGTRPPVPHLSTSRPA